MTTADLSLDALDQAKGALALAATYVARGKVPPAGVRRALIDAVTTWSVLDAEPVAHDWDDIREKLGLGPSPATP